ncbi:MAG: hypothetical protein IPN17_13220 [Deltaproteobacteria bacterium]|nr:hypothetical protein [Deltaproteobacteria bacterium]
MIPRRAYERQGSSVDPGCDCNRVLLKVIARSNEAEVATIGHGFDAKRSRSR